MTRRIYPRPGTRRIGLARWQPRMCFGAAAASPARSGATERDQLSVSSARTQLDHVSHVPAEKGETINISCPRAS